LSLPPPFRPADIPFQPHLLSSRSVVEVRSEQELREALNKARKSTVEIPLEGGAQTATFSAVTILICGPIRLTRKVTIGSDLHGLEIRSAGFNPITGNLDALFRLDGCSYVRLIGLAMPLRLDDNLNRVCVELDGCGLSTISGCWLASDQTAIKTQSGDTVSTKLLIESNWTSDIDILATDTRVCLNEMDDATFQDGSADISLCMNNMGDGTIAGTGDCVATGNTGGGSFTGTNMSTGTNI
jgi:hypothetical protein